MITHYLINHDFRANVRIALIHNWYFWFYNSRLNNISEQTEKYFAPDSSKEINFKITYLIENDLRLSQTKQTITVIAVAEQIISLFMYSGIKSCYIIFTRSAHSL